MKINIIKVDDIQKTGTDQKVFKHERVHQENTEGKSMVTTPTLC